MMIRPWSRVAPYKRGNLDLGTHTEGECHVDTKAGIRVMCLQAKRHQRLG